MKGGNMDITIKYQSRPCYVRRLNTMSKDTKAMFHCWAQEKGKGLYDPVETKALVEFENGSIKKVKPELIRFIDGGAFNEISWTERTDS